MCLQMLIGKLLEIAQDLFLDNRRKALDLLNQDSFVHLNCTHIAKWLPYRLLLHVAHVLAQSTCLALHSAAIALGQFKFLRLEVKQARLFVNVVLQH